MEASALRHAARVPVLTGLSPHLRLQGDERLVALVRRGHQGAFEVLVRRYQARLLAFCRHMLGSNEDAEDVLQEVFASAYGAICADDRPINARPWLYRIARNRCLNHLRRPQAAGQESMDVFERESGTTAADTVHRREEFRQIITDVGELPETQRAALLLREIDTLSYDQIADAMDTSVSSVKSLLVRARMSLAEASEARQLTCAEVRLELTQAAEGIAKPSSPTRRHVRSCNRCRSFRRELRKTSTALAAVYPVGPVIAAKAMLGGSAGAGNGAAGGTTVAGGAAMAGGGATGVLSAVGGSLVTKAAAGLVAAAIVTAGAGAVKSGGGDRDTASSSGAPVEPTDERLRPSPPAQVVHSPAHRPNRADRATPAAAAAPALEPRPADLRPAAEPPRVAPPVEQPVTVEQPVVEPEAPATEGAPAPPPEGETATSEGLPPPDSDTGGFPSVTDSSGASSGGGGTSEPPTGQSSGSRSGGAAVR